MHFSLDTEILKQYNLSPNKITILRLFQQGLLDELKEMLAADLMSQEDITELLADAYLKLKPRESSILSLHCLELGQTFFHFISKTTENVSEWIDDWRELFPDLYTSYPLRGDRNGCLANMNIFVSQYSYSKHIIFEATKQYLSRASKDNYKYCKSAVRFIASKQISDLAAECEAIVRSEFNVRSEQNLTEL